MKSTWKRLSPPNTEASLIGKWFGVCYKGKKSETLYISKFVFRFLYDMDGDVTNVVMRSLKPKFGSGTVLEDTPSHLPPDESTFELTDVICGPLEVNPLRGASKFNVPAYEKVKQIFDIVKNKDRGQM